MSKHQRKVNQKTRHNNVSQPPMPPSPPPPNGGENQDGREGGDKRDQNAKQEYHPSEWPSKITAACTAVLVVITGIYTHYAGQQACANITAANAAASSAQTAAQLLEMDRPYVSIDLTPTSDLKFTPDGRGYLRLGSTVINYGRNPALNARIWVQFLSQAKGSPKSETDPTAFCENLQSKGKSIESIFGGTYFPQVPYKASWIAEDQGGEAAEASPPTLIACVAYQSPFSKEWLYTGEMYTVMRMRHEELGGALLPARGEIVPQKDLVLAPFMNSAISK